MKGIEKANIPKDKENRRGNDHKLWDVQRSKTMLRKKAVKWSFSEWSLMLDLVDKNYNSYYKNAIEN